MCCPCRRQCSSFYAVLYMWLRCQEFMVGILVIVHKSCFKYQMAHKMTNGKRNNLFIVRITCAVLWCVFSFLYLFFYQADILAVSQHILSGGVTVYNGLVGAVIITAVLLLLQFGVSSVIKFDVRWYALSYFPSVLLLSILSSMSPGNDGVIKVEMGVWLSLFFALAWIGLIAFLSRGREGRRSGTKPDYFALHNLWVNVFIMSVLMLFTGVAGNNHTVIHYRMRVEACLKKNDFEGALRVGRKSSDSDPTLTMMRVYALAREGKLGDELFKYPVRGGSRGIVPMDSIGTKCLLYSNDSIYAFLGARPKTPMGTYNYLYALRRAGYASPAVKDYILCGYLLDRRLDDFVKMLPEFYEINDSLPLHYREALTLYTHLRATPAIVYHNDVMDTDYEDLQALERKAATPQARAKTVYDQYAGTYWWYYEYGHWL